MKRTKRIVSLILTILMIMSVIPISVISASALTGNQRTDIIDVAIGQLGNTNGSKYTFGAGNVSWCAYFIVWCARQANIDSSIIKTTGWADADDLGVKYYSRGSYTPKKGDIIIFDYQPYSTKTPASSYGDHVGLVEYVEGNTVHTIEGNSSPSPNAVRRHSYALTNTNIKGYGAPNYKGSPAPTHTVDTKYGKNFTAYPKAKITASDIFDANHNQISSTAWIGTSDKCTINEVYTDGCCKVTYPLDGGGTKTVYSKISLFITHTHNYSGARLYESEHPHAISQRCVDYDTCGGYIWTGEYYKDRECSKCWSAQLSVSKSYVDLQVGESETVTVNISGVYPSGGKVYNEYDESILSYTLESGKLTIKGLKAGSTKFTISVYSDYKTNAGAVLLATASCTVTVNDKPVFFGDYNLDGVINITDVTNVNRIRLNEVNYTDADLFRCDVDADGGVDLDDVELIQKVTANIISLYDLPAYKYFQKFVVKTSPNKTTYVCGEKLDTNGLVLEALFSNGTRHTVSSGLTCSGYNSSEIGKQSIRVEHYLGAAYFTVTVNPKTYTISYNANGGTGAPSNQTKVYGQTLTLSSTKPTRTGYTFLGWSTSNTATSATYSAGGSYTANAGATLYAVWQKNPVTVSSISIRFLPTKATYTVGDKFDASGLAIRVTMSDGTTKTLTSGFTVSSPDMTTAGTKTVTVSYSGKTTTFNITVKEPVVLSSIFVQTLPTKTLYTVGDKFDASGLVIRAIMSNGTSTTLTSGFTVSSPDMSTAGTKRVIVSYGGKTADFTITVEAPVPPVGTAALRLDVPAHAVVGQKIQIPVMLENASVGTLTFTVEYDATKLKYVSNAESAFDMCDVNSGTAGFLKAACIDGAAVPAGKVIVLTFEVIAPDACSTNLVLTVEEAYDGKDNPVSMVGGTWDMQIVKSVPGDVNGDGRVTAIDARWVLQASSGARTLDNAQTLAADVNGDGKVSAIDARWILQVASGARIL